MVREFFQNFDQFWRFDGVTILHAIVVIPASFVLPIWMIISVAIGLDSVLQLPDTLDLLARAAFAVFFTFFGSYVFRAWNGFGEVRAGFISKVIAACIFVLLVLQITGVINLIPG